MSNTTYFIVVFFTALVLFIISHYVIVYLNELSNIPSCQADWNASTQQTDNFDNPVGLNLTECNCSLPADIPSDIVLKTLCDNEGYCYAVLK